MQKKVLLRKRLHDSGASVVFVFVASKHVNVRAEAG